MSDGGPHTVEGAGMPKDIHYAHIFQIFNTVSFSIVLGLPMILFFKHLDASATVLGIVASLPPLLNILQIPAASLVEKVGYRVFVLRGWTLRSFIILGMVLVPLLLHFLDAGTALALMLFLLFLYNTSRGISACGFLPWMTHLVPEGVRGTFVSRDQACGALAGFATMLLIAALFHGARTELPFGIAFFLSFLAALASLTFLRKIPDVPVPVESRNREAVPWRAMLLYPPFLKLLVYNVVMNSAFAAAGVFWIPALRDLFHWDDSRILLLASFGNGLAIFIIWFFGKMVDRVGSRPLLAFSGLALVIHFSVWFSFCSGFLRIGPGSLVLLQVTSACGSGIFNMANTRLVMGTVPALGRSHFFALHSVINSLTLGFLPIVWGVILDAVRDLHWRIGSGEFNRYSLLYVTLFLITGVALYLLKRLDEPKAMTTDAFFYELLVASPSRALTRLIGIRRTLP